MRLQKRRVTIRDVAEAAGLSPTSVSRFLNGKLQLPTNSATRINDAITRLGYKPNAVAQSLSLGESKTIGVIVPNISNPFFADIVEAAEETAFAEGYSLLLSNAGDDAQRTLRSLDLFSRHMADGVLLLVNDPDAGILTDVTNEHDALIVVDEDIPGTSAPRVFSQNRVGAQQATEYLLSMGHTRIAHVGGPTGLYSAEERMAGYRDAMDAVGLRVDPRLIIRGPYTRTFGFSSLHEILTAEPTAVFCASDFVAMGILDGARRIGVDIPRDLSLVGFDDAVGADLLYPRLTTVRQPTQRLGQESMRHLLAIVHGTAPPSRSPVLLPVELTIRDSVLRLEERGRR